MNSDIITLMVTHWGLVYLIQITSKHLKITLMTVSNQNYNNASTKQDLRGQNQRCIQTENGEYCHPHFEKFDHLCLVHPSNNLYSLLTVAVAPCMDKYGEDYCDRHGRRWCNSHTNYMGISKGCEKYCDKCSE